MGLRFIANAVNIDKTISFVLKFSGLMCSFSPQPNFEL